MANGVIIPELPQASGLSASDLLVKDDGTTTQKLPVINAYASDSQPGLVNIGNQSFGGNFKRFKGSVVTGSADTRYPKIFFQSRDDVQAFASVYADKGGIISDSYGDTALGAQIWSANTDGTLTDKSEFFNLPTVDRGRTSDAYYTIITTKGIVNVNAGDKTIGSNGYVSINDVKPSGTILAAWVRTYSSISPVNAINVTGDGNFLFGTPNTTVTGLVVTYLVV